MPTVCKNRKARYCPACFGELSRFAFRCPNCGEPIGRKQQAKLFADRYIVGFDAGDGTHLCLDTETNTVKRIALTKNEEAFFARHGALAQLASCPFVALADEIAFDNGIAAAVFEKTEPIAEGLDAKAFLKLLNTVANALLVLHSLFEEDAPWGDAVFGIPAITFIRETGEDYRLLILPIPQMGEPQTDIVNFGKLLSLLCPPDADALRRVVSRMASGSYVSVLELLHDLNCLQ